MIIYHAWDNRQNVHGNLIEAKINQYTNLINFFVDFIKDIRKVYG